MEMFFVAGISIALLIEFLLISKKNKSESDTILTTWMFFILVHLFLFYLYFTLIIYDFPFLLGIEAPLPLLHGVFLFLYASYLTSQLPEKRGLLFFHFLPATIMYFYLITFFIMPSDQKIQIYKNQGAGYETYNIIRHYAITCSGIFYVAWTVLLLRTHQRHMRDQFSDLQKVSLQWLQFLTIGMGVIWFLMIVFRNDVLVFGGIVLFVFLIGFFGVRQVDIFAHNNIEDEKIEQKKKYTKSGLTEEASEKLHRSLLDLMVNETPYKKSELTIGDLSTKLGVHPNYLSQIINENEGKNFYDFINTYRIEEFKRLISDPKNHHLTLLSLAFDCGFNSKSSFNRYFKKATGTTPSEYFTTLTPKQHY
jgi:AraC-like DNA-binding protein